MPCCLPCRKAGGLQILSRRRRDQGIAVVNYSFTLDVLTLKPSGFCNVGVNTNKISTGLRQNAGPKRSCIFIRWFVALHSPGNLNYWLVRVNPLLNIYLTIQGFRFTFFKNIHIGDRIDSMTLMVAHSSALIL